MRRNVLLILPLLAACASEQEMCINRQTKELRTVQSLLAEVEANIARGYAWDSRTEYTTQWDECETRITDNEGKRITISKPCLRDVAEEVRFRVPIDPVVEQRKRDNLSRRRNALMASAEAGVKACKIAYPDKD